MPTAYVADIRTVKAGVFAEGLVIGTWQCVSAPELAGEATRHMKASPEMRVDFQHH